VRLMLAPKDGWTRATLTAAVRVALPGLPALWTDRYAPTVAITEHVQARNPRCAAFDCARVSRHADLDHDQPWPRGPTDVSNLSPRCRRHHELKTRGLVTTRLLADGTVLTGMLTRITVTTGPEPRTRRGLRAREGMLTDTRFGLQHDRCARPRQSVAVDHCTQAQATAGILTSPRSRDADTPRWAS
jgi:hypothetical protein